MKTYQVDTTTAKALKTLDGWLSKQPWKQNVQDMNLVLQVRDIISQIEDKGYYNKEERDILNGVRNHWFESKYKGQWVCRYCLKSTKDVEYDYLNGTDHLECELKEQMGDER